MKILLFFLGLAVSSIGLSIGKISLSKQCPPSFELLDGVCHFRSIYDLYQSPHGKGVGGLRTALPKHRGAYRPEEIDLGRYLFFDPILSTNYSQSCSSCHDPDKGFSDGKARSVGALGQDLSRNAPSLWNAGFWRRLNWDAKAKSLEEQARGPLYGHNELAMTKSELLKRLRESAVYRELFQQAFANKSPHDIQEAQVLKALAAFQSSLVSFNSAYDRYVHGHQDALNESQMAGLNVFRSFVARCAECHTPPLFSNQEIAVIGTPEVKGLAFDKGAELVFNQRMLRGGFRVPSLRNIAKSAPYMHSGGIENLKDAIRFYTKGRGHAVPKDEYLYIHWHIWEPQLTDEEIDLLAEFLMALTDESLKPQRPKTIPSMLGH